MTAHLPRPLRLATADRGGGQERRPGATRAPGSVVRAVVTSEHALVSEAVAASLRTHGVHAWSTSRAMRATASPVLGEEAEVGVVLADLLPARRLTGVRNLVRQHRLRWLLVTGSPRGALWGAALEAGVASVLPSTTTGDEVAEALVRIARGEAALDPLERAELLRRWHVDQAERRQIEERLARLTPRERAVLELLYVGESVRTITELYGVSQSTVRSQVRSVLRKLEVNSQLAAAALWARVHDAPDREPLGRT